MTDAQKVEALLVALAAAQEEAERLRAERDNARAAYDYLIKRCLERGMEL